LAGREGAQTLGRSSSDANGRGVVRSAELLGKAYLTSGSPEASRAIGELLGDTVRSPIETDADKSVHIELRRSGQEWLLHLVNPARLWNRKVPKQRDVSIRIDLPADVIVTGVQLTSPEPAGKAGKSASNDSVMEAFAKAASKQPRKGARRVQARRPTPDRTGAIGTRGKKVVESAATDQGAGKAVNLAYTVEGSRVSFKVPLEAYEMVVISTKPR
jgi:hypothetical protein